MRPGLTQGALTFSRMFHLDRLFFSKSGFLFFKINLFIYLYFWLRWVFGAAHGLSLVAASGGYSLLWCAGFSLRWFLLLRRTGSRAQAQ